MNRSARSNSLVRESGPQGNGRAFCASCLSRLDPWKDVKIPKDNNGRSKNFAFVTFVHSESVGYTLALMDGVSLYRRRIRMERRPQATVDDTYVNMMERHYQYMNSVRASANMFHPPGSMWGSSCAPQHEMEQRNQMPMDMPFPSERSFGYESSRNGPHAYPPDNDYKCYDRYYGQDRHEQQDRYDRQGRHFRAADPPPRIFQGIPL
ncbi:hypothetical protein MTO96_006593 [Rhipicephalus appendiculatus]